MRGVEWGWHHPWKEEGKRLQIRPTGTGKREKERVWRRVKGRKPKEKWRGEKERKNKREG